MILLKDLLSIMSEWDYVEVYAIGESIYEDGYGHDLSKKLTEQELERKVIKLKINNMGDGLDLELEAKPNEK